MFSKTKAAPNAAWSQLAQAEGLQSRGLRAAQVRSDKPSDNLLAQLRPGELVLLGARPGQGKTLVGLDLAIRSVQAGRFGWFFSLEWSASDLQRGLGALGASPSALSERFQFDNSDAICATYIIERLAAAASNTVVVIDYLQVLDQKREHPPIAVQVQSIREFVRSRELVVVFLAQIDRSFDSTGQALPGLADIRLPNPLDLKQFDKACFLHKGAIQIAVTN